MSISVMTKVWETSIPTAEKMVLLVIADKCNDDGTNAWPGIKTIARKASMTTRSVQRHIRTLEARGVLITLFQAGGNANTRGDRRPNRYDIVLSALSGVTNCHPAIEHDDAISKRGDKQDATGRQTAHNGVTPMSPYPSPSVLEASNTRASSNEFEEFWATYPRSEGKAAAVKAWARLTPDEREEALQAIHRHVAYWTAVKTERRYIPHASSWLNGRRWEDELRHPIDDMSLTKRVARFALDADKLATTKEHA